MVVIFLIALLWLTNWVFATLLIFVPLNLAHGLESLLGYGILGTGVILCSWLIGKSK